MHSSRAVGRRIRALCKENGISYAELAERTGEPFRRIQRLALGGGPTNPGVFTIKAICDVFGLTVEEFLAGDEFKEDEENHD